MDPGLKHRGLGEPCSRQYWRPEQLLEDGVRVSGCWVGGLLAWVSPPTFGGNIKHHPAPSSPSHSTLPVCECLCPHVPIPMT